MVGLEVEPHLAGQAVALEEAGHGGGVVVVLVLGRLGRLGLDQDRPLEPDPVLVLDHQVEEAGELRLLAGQVGVEQGLVALAPAPQDVVGPAEGVGGLEGVAPPGRRPRRRPRDRGWWPPRRRSGGGRRGWRCPTAGGRRCGPCGRPPRRPWRPGGPPSRPASPPRVRCPGRGSRRTACPAWRRTRRRRPSSAGPPPAGRSPTAFQGRSRVPVAEDVRPRPHEAVPVADGHPQVVLHAPSGHHPVGVVPPEGQRVVAVRARHRGSGRPRRRTRRYPVTTALRLGGCASPHHRVRASPGATGPGGRRPGPAGSSV